MDSVEKTQLQLVNCIKMCAMRRVLVLGAQGQLGTRLLTLAQNRMDMEVAGWGRSELDICDREAVARRFQQWRPDVVINAAAYTAVDAAESDRETAWNINAVAPGGLAEEARKVGASFVHISTDYVFDGSAERPYRVEDSTGPLGVYGASKLAGEEAVEQGWKRGGEEGHAEQETQERWWIFRVAWLYDADGKNFLRTMMSAARRGASLKVVDDQRGTPTCAAVFAEFLLDLAADGAQLPGGIWHYGHAGITTWYGFAKEIFERLGWQPPLAPCGTDAYPTVAQRPAYSHLDPEPLHAAWGGKLMEWQEALGVCLGCMSDAEKTWRE